MKKILVIGSANMDLTLNMFRLPAPGETITDDGGIAYIPGGRGAGAAVALHRLGADCTFCAKLGQDLHGQKLYNFYKSEGLSTAAIKVDPNAPTGLAVVMNEADGKRRTLVYPGANATLSSENILDAFACEPDALYLGFEIPFSMVLTAARIAASKGIPIIVDASPASKEYPLDQLPPVEIFSPNEEEAEEYVGIRPAGSDSSLRAALALYRKVKCRYLVIKQGSRGAFLYDGKHYHMIPAPRPDKVVDTTAAGDAFTAALTVAYLESGDMTDATRFACAAGAITVSREGAASTVPSASEVLAFRASRGY